MHAVVLVLFLAVVFLGEPVLERAVNGRRVGPMTKPGPDGIIRTDPAALARAAGLEVNVYALARSLSSEHGRDGDSYLRAVAWATRNKARERGITILQLLTDGKGVAGDGFFGEQKAAAGTKYASTQLDPYERHVRIALEVMGAPLSADPTRGATHYYSPRASDQLAARAETDPNYAKYRGNTAAVVDARWRAPGGLYPEGAVPVVPPGVNPRQLTLYRRATA